ncbi:transposase [Planctomycetota bacterium]
MPSSTTTYDSPWKEALERFFPAFMELLFPEVHRDIDWSEGFEFLDKELQRVVRDAQLGTRLADKLIKLRRRTGDETWVLVHVEVQGQVDPELPLRMYVYNYRIFDRYRKPVASLAVLGDERCDWRPSRFGYGFWGCRVHLDFLVCKILDWEARWAELERSANPFAVILMAHLKALRTRKDPENRLYWKIQVAKSLYRRGFMREEILELLRLIDWLLALPEELERVFTREIICHEEEIHMPYVMSAERLGREDGREEGRAALLEVARAQFGESVANELLAIEDLDSLRDRVLELLARDRSSG